MVTKAPDLLHVWWGKLNEIQMRDISIHLGYLPSIMDFKVWPTFIEVITQICDNDKMVLKFGNVEITPTLKKIKDCMDSIKMCGRSKKHTYHHILLPDKPTSLKLKDILRLVNAD